MESHWDPFATNASTVHEPTSVSNDELYLSWFQTADTDGDGRLTGPDAVTFFQRSGLQRDALAKVWAAADYSRRGFLDLPAFAKAMELISVAQRTGKVGGEAYTQAKAMGVAPPRMAGLEKKAGPGSHTERGGINPFGGAESSESTPRLASSPPVGVPPFKLAFPPQAEASSHPSTARTTSRRHQSLRRPVMTTKEAVGISEGLKNIYFNKIRPLEDGYKFGHFFSPLLSAGDFEAKPSVLLLGQYSTGKSTFIKFLLGRDYPGIHIGPEPTTDRFVVVMHGPEERRTPGNTLVVQPDKPYTGLSQFGNGFLSKFESAQCDNRLLEEISLVDTPGVLSGEKQRIERTYDFIQVCGWFAARCDLILLLFDPYKLDISDEFKEVISTLRGHDDKVRIVLNKADSVDQQQLMRVYGALMWSLGKVFRSPEVCRVYIGSFNASNPIRDDVNPTCKPLFEKEQEDLLHDLYDIPARSCDRKVNEFVKRVRAAKIHCLIMGHLRKQMPYFGQKKAQEKLMDNLANEFRQGLRSCIWIQHPPDAIANVIHPADAGDFPDVNRYRDILSAFDISKFTKLDKSMIKQIDDSLSIDIPQLVRQMDNPYV
ncbi:EH domain-containing protein 1 [Auxenochlorella protothecoides]|uniref:EH domain-containing protein 1 n=1 Tax=Auxenochlorella protothecoides TaxID=3075 RepID=A0A087SU79_AUXPR|nr:EH domain-containing protein 1 [Auxenochlorella protothecoides]KFM29283.1 EH domain-containing protein 1 [Auxenochlorella protothecoides]